MHASDLGRLLGLQLPAGLAEQRVDEQAAAHADTAVDTPDRELDADALERDAPGEHVLVYAVDQRAVEIEQKSGTGGHASGNVIPGRRTPGPCPGVRGSATSTACHADAPAPSGSGRSPRRTWRRASSPWESRSRAAPGRAPCRPGSRAASCSRTAVCCRA